MFLILYVDDGLVIGYELKKILAVKRSLSKEFEKTDSGEVTSFLGMKIERDVEGRFMRMSQQKYLLDMLARFNMFDCKLSTDGEPASTGERRGFPAYVTAVQ